MTNLAALLPWLFGIFVVVALVGGFVFDRKRRQRIMQYAVARGWTYVDEDPSLADRWQSEPFGRGDTRRARNVIRGHEHGRPFVAFDYSYETHSTDSQGRRTATTHRFAVCVVTIPAYLPSLEVAPEGLFRKMATAVGLTTDIDLESEDFNRAFCVRAADRKFATDVLSPRTMEFLLTAPSAAWRVEGTEMFRWQTGRLDPADVVVSTSVLDRLADGIPSFVWKDYEVRPGYDPQS